MNRWVGGDDSNKLAVSLGRHIVVSFIASISHDQSTCFSYFHEDVKIQATNRQGDSSLDANARLCDMCGCVKQRGNWK